MAGAKLDPIDLRILDAIQRDGRITKLALAEKVGLSPTPCWMRLRKLEKAGIVSGYHAKLAMRAVAPVATVLMEVTLGSHRQADFERFERAIRDIPEIVACWSVGGGVDYVLKVMARDIDAYQRLVDALLERELGIDRYFTYIVIKTVKDDTVLPLEILASQPDEQQTISLERGVIGRAMPQGDILGFAPPLCLTRDEAYIVVKATADAVTSVFAKL